MCGRYSLHDPDRALREFSILEKGPKLAPRYNIAPSQLVPVVRVLSPAEGRRVDEIRWGFESRHSRGRVIMVRTESLVRGAFSSAFRGGRRCIFLADGFYEWSHEGKQRVPHHAALVGGAPLAIAGICETKDGRDACAVITKPAVAPLLDLHDRMPAVVTPADYERWLDPDFHDVPDLERMLSADIGLDLEVNEVSPYVNSPKNDGPECLEPKRAE